MDFKMGQNQLTSWVNYPHQYKFFSVHFTLNTDIQMIDRTTYDFLDMIGDCGGVLEVFLILFSMLAHPVSLKQLKAHITSRMFVLSSHIRNSILDKVDLTDK
jgi:hypothetical protein